MPYYGGQPINADAQALMAQFMRRGYSRAQAAAIVGNMQRESGLKSNNINKNEGAYGLMQWRGPRLSALQSYAAQQGKAWTDPSVQADFLHQEMQTTERKNAAAFAGAQTVDEATAALKPVIRYGDNSLAQRQAFARDLYGSSGKPDSPDAPKAAAAPAEPPPTSPGAQPAAYDPAMLAYARAYDLNPVKPANAQRPLRYGMAQLGEGLGARFNPGGGLQGLKDKLSGVLGMNAPAQEGAPIPGELPPPQQQQPPADFVPMPRPRPENLRGTPAGYSDDRLILPGSSSVADLGALVDPARYEGFDYG